MAPGENGGEKSHKEEKCCLTVSRTTKITLLIKLKTEETVFLWKFNNEYFRCFITQIMLGHENKIKMLNNLF